MICISAFNSFERQYAILTLCYFLSLHSYFHCFAAYYQISMSLRVENEKRWKTQITVVVAAFAASAEVWWKKFIWASSWLLNLLLLRSAKNLLYGLRHWNTTELCSNFLSDQTTQLFHFPRCPSDLYYCQQQRCFDSKLGLSAGFTDSDTHLTS